MKELFLFHSLIGEGGFGKVLSALMLKPKQWCAVKCINKFELLKHKSGPQMLFGELKALSVINHTFITSLRLAFQDRFDFIV